MLQSSRPEAAPARTPDATAARNGAWLPWVYVLSGSSGLCYEILWSRQLAAVLGATSRAIATVVALFMAGLALGSLLGARLSRRSPAPARAYGQIEIAIGVVGAGVTLTLPHLEGLTTMVARHAVAAVLVLGASTLMGMTFPLVAEAFGKGRRGASTLLYGVNTAGAALGCLGAGFVGIGLWGLRTTGLVAAAVNLVCGVVAWRLGGAIGRGDAGGAAAATDGPATGDGTGADDVQAVRHDAPWGAGQLAVVAALCGASALAVEILWTRALVPYLNSSTYAFAAILAVYLASLAVGSIATAGWAARRDDVAVARALVVAQAVLAVLVVASVRILDVVEDSILGEAYVGVRRIMSVADWLPTVARIFERTFLTIALPTALMGASFSLCLRLAGTAAAPGVAAGRVSAANTGGAIVGSLLAGFVVLPAVGVLRGIVLAATVNLIVAALVALGAPRRRPTLVRSVGWAALAALAMLVARSPRAFPFVGRLADDTRILLVDEGPQDTTAVIERTQADGRRHRVVLSNGISYTGDDVDSRRYMALLGHLPVLLAHDPSDSLVVCIGTGMTAAAVARHPEVTHLDLVDISPAVHHTLPLFAEVNDQVWRDPRVRIHEADGRQFMGRSPRGWGVVTLEPPPPRAAGAASLYTVELYQRIRAALRPGGMVAQWLPLHGLSLGELRLITRTMLRVFPGTALFVLNGQEAALVASDGPFAIDLARVRARLAHEAIGNSLRRVGFEARDDEGLLAELLALVPLSGPGLARLVGEGDVITDDHPLIEQFAVALGADANPSAFEDGRGPFLRAAMAVAEPPPTVGQLPQGLEAAQASFRAWLARKLPPPHAHAAQAD